MNKKLGLFFVLAVAFIALSVFAQAGSWVEPNTPAIKEMRVYVEDDATLWYGYCYPDPLNPPTWICETTQYETPSFNRGESVEVKVAFIPTFNSGTHPITVKTWLTGYKNDIEDETSPFDVFANYTYLKILNLDIPEDADATEDYTLRVEISSQTVMSGVSRAEIATQIQKQSNTLEIKHLELYAEQNECSCSVEQITKGVCGECNTAFVAGSSVCVDATVRNRGSQEAEDVYLTLSIADMCIEKVAYLGDIDADGGEDDTVEKTICFVIPEDTKAGTYSLSLKVEGDDASDSVTQSFSVKAAESKPVESSEVDVVLQQTSASVEQGKGVVYSLFIANLGTEQTFIVSTEGTDGWASTQINPQVFTLGKGESKTVNVYLAANEDAVASEHVFAVKIKYGDTTKVYNFNANVTEKPSVLGNLDLKTILMIAAIVLAVIIIILLIVLLAKKGGSSKVEETYY